MNYSIVDLDDIITGDGRLFCLTNTDSCCRASDTPDGVGGVGVWYFPDGTEVPGSSTGFSRDRGTSFVALSRGSSSNVATGLFRCEIPEVMKVTTYMLHRILFYFSTPLVRNVPRLPNIEETSSTERTVTIAWSFTSVLETRNEIFTVLYGTSPGQLGPTSPPVSSVPDVNQYSIQLMSLQPGTTYYYQLQSVNNFRNLTTLLNTIRTMDSSKCLNYRLAAVNSCIIMSYF